MSENRQTKSLDDTPIALPKHPFWEVFQRFGKDETIALIINALAVFIITFILNRFFHLSQSVKGLIISLSGPVFEKIGFFPAHFWESWKEYKMADKKNNPRFGKYFKKALKTGSKSLLEDVLIHDPLYTVMMYCGIVLYSATPPWILSITSFVIAVLMVSFLEVTYNEISYYRFKKSLKKIGFEVESYYETRFLISKEKDAAELIRSVIKEFGLEDYFERDYRDTYFNNNFRSFSGRTPQLYLRWRTKRSEIIQSVQVVYNKALEIEEKSLSQFRYFALRKDKIYADLHQPMPAKLEEILNERIRGKLIKHSENRDGIQVNFKRLVSYNRNSLFVSVDIVEKIIPYYVVELKVYHDKELLKKAMRFVMREFPVIQTTYRKFDLIDS